jgi:hypothetical protein
MWMWILFFILIIVLVIVLSQQGYLGNTLKELFSFIGGTFGGVFGGEDAQGYFFKRGTKEAKEVLKNLKVDGHSIIKNVIIEGPLEVTGYVEMRNCEVKGKSKISGSAMIVGSELNDIELDGYLDLYKSKAKKIKTCGKMKAKSSEIDEVEIKEKCSYGVVKAPYVVLKGSQVGKVKVPKDLKEEEAVIQK